MTGVPLKGVMTSAHALSFYERWQEVTANNLANASTDGFKFERLTAALQNDGTDAPAAVEKLNLTQGPIQQTGRPLDIALQGQGFLEVKTPQGTRLSRGGSLHLDASGMLVDQDGNAIMGTQGPIVIPDVGDVTINPSGEISVNQLGSPQADSTLVGTLKIVTVKDPSTLTQEGSGRLAANSPIEEAAPDAVTIEQGAVENPNSDSILGMVDLVTIQRAYSANLDALKAMDSVMDTVAGQLAQTS